MTERTAYRGGIWEDAEIHRAHTDGRINISPFEPMHVQPASYDIHLSSWIRILTSREPLDYYHLEKAEWEEIFLPDRGRVLEPQEFALLGSLERFRFGPGVTGQLDGSSTLSRCGLAVHQTGQWIDPGFQGNITLEARCQNGVGFRLYPRMKIGQIIFQETKHPAQRPYAGRYQEQGGAQPPRSPKVRF